MFKGLSLWEFKGNYNMSILSSFAVHQVLSSNDFSSLAANQFDINMIDISNQPI